MNLNNIAVLLRNRIYVKLQERSSINIEDMDTRYYTEVGFREPMMMRHKLHTMLIYGETHMIARNLRWA